MAKLNGIDCVTKLNQESAEALKSNGIEYVGRYLGNSWKSMNNTEAKVINNAGVKIVSIWESNPTFPAYFSKDQGLADGKEASAFAKSLGQEEGSAIYFTVDYDAAPREMDAILDYFLAIRQGLGSSYKVGVYGSCYVLTMVHNRAAADYYWQTTAWSRGKVADFIDILQYGFNQKLMGIPVDYNQVSNSAGSWCKQSQKRDIPLPAPSKTYTIQPGDTLSGIAARFGTTINELARVNNIQNPNIIYAGHILMIPGAALSSEQKSYTVKPGDTLSQIAIQFGTSVSQLRAWNRIVNPDLIRAGQRMRVH